MLVVVGQTIHRVTTIGRAADDTYETTYQLAAVRCTMHVLHAITI